MFESLQERLGSVLAKLTGQGVLSEKDVSKALKEISQALTEADVSLKVVREFTSKVHEKAIGKEILKSVKPGQMIVKIVHDALVEMLGNQSEALDLQAPAPITIMAVGLQGAGKTTTCAKIAYRLSQKQNKKVLMASLDTHRPAAQEQLQQLGEQAKITSLPIIAGQNPLQIAVRALQAAKTGGYDILILDTAGRTHIDHLSMAEMAEIKKIAQPHETLLVVDALIGQDAANIASEFNKYTDITGIVLTRMDSDARGGAALSMKAVTGKPIKLIGSGEKIDALEEFHPQRMADRIIGMGDIVSLVEKAAESFDKEKADLLSAKIKAGRFDLNDLANQLQQMQKMGGMSKILSMMPGAAQIKDRMAMAGMDDKSLKRQLAVISSMTKKERESPEILKHSRKKRIAQGSGTDATEINKLLKMHRNMTDAIKAMKNNKGIPSLNSFLGSPPQGMSSTGLMKNFSGMNMPSSFQALKKIKSEAEESFLNEFMQETQNTGLEKSRFSLFSGIKSVETRKKK